MNLILPELANTLVEERLHRAQARYVAKSRSPHKARIEEIKVLLLDRLHELIRVLTHTVAREPR